MQTPKTSRNASSDVRQRTSPATPRSSRVAKTGGSESDSTGVTPTRTPTERSPKVPERRSPRSPVTEKKRPSRISELETQVNQLQEELKKAKDQFSSSETSKKRAQQEADEIKKQLQATSAKLEDSQSQLVEISATEDSRLQELRNISQERDSAWQTELEALQNQQSVDYAALSSSQSEIHKLKEQLDMAAESEAVQARRLEEATSERETLKQEMEQQFAAFETLKVQLNDSEKAEAKSKQQLEIMKTAVESLCSEGVQIRECLASKDMELELNKAQIKSLEEMLQKLQPKQQNEQSVADLIHEEYTFDAQTEKLRVALETAETQKIIAVEAAREMLENAKAEYEHNMSNLELELKNRNAELVELKSTIADKELCKNANANEMQPELERKLMKSINDITELKANLMDKETALQSIMEENETVKSEIGRKDAEARQKYESAVAELELAKAAEQDVRMRLGYITEEADKSGRRAARISEQLDAAQAVNVEMESELRRLRVQSDQWRKAAEAAASALTSGNNGQVMERTGSLDPEFNSIGGKLMSSPFSDDLDVDSPKRKSSSVLRRMSGLWKKSPK